MLFNSFIFFLSCLIVSVQGSRFADQWDSHNEDVIANSRRWPNFDMEDDDCFDATPSRRNLVPAHCQRASRVYSPTFDRRISEIKCFEYLWNISYDAFKAKKEDQCKMHSRISLGSYSNTFDHPHVAALGWGFRQGGWVFLCGGSLISPEFVLTAAYCASIKRHDLTNDQPQIVRLGYDDLLLPDEETKEIKIAIILAHPKYNPERRLNDIALVKLKNHVEFTRVILPACLWSYDDMGHLFDEVQMAGYGSVNDDELKLRSGTVELHGQQNCKGIKPEQLCFGSTLRLGSQMFTQGPNSCKIDTGGPLHIETPVTNTTYGKIAFLVGVLSFYDFCYDKKLREHTRVSSHLDWIERIVWPVPALPPPVTEDNAKVFVLPEPFSLQQSVHLEIKSTATDHLSVSLMVDKNGVDYNNVALQVTLDFGQQELRLESVKYGFTEGLENEGYSIEHIFFDGVLDITFKVKRNFDLNQDFLEIRMGRGRVVLHMNPYHELSSIRYLIVEGEDTTVKVFEVNYYIE